jgi:phosphatidylglycerophosphate synthase
VAASQRAHAALIASLQEVGAMDVSVVDVAKYGGNMVWNTGLALIWLAAALTLVTGWDYFRKALPHLKDR